MSRPNSVSVLRLTGPWQLQPVPLTIPFTPDQLTDSWHTIPECGHLQPLLYPDRPYWGAHLRALNASAWIYQRTFTVPDAPFERARLHFEGVDYFAEVWVNHICAGQHEGHFAPFDVDITRLIEPGANLLTVRVSSPWDAPNPGGTYPTDHVLRGLVKGHYEHGEGVIPPDVNPIGIWRPVSLSLDGGVSLDHVRIHTDLAGQVDVRLRLTNATAVDWHGMLALTITADNHTGAGARRLIPVTLPPGTHAIDQQLHLPDVHLWWCWDQGAPDLYRLEACLLDETRQPISMHSERFGVRTIRLERHPQHFVYWLNERPVYIRGSSYMPALYLSQCSAATLAQDIDLARAAHLNLLRAHVHVAPPEFYAVCDAQGMLVWQDFELNWIQDPSPEFERRARTLQRDMIDQLGNHPSIITWACHNEPTMLFARRHNLEQHPDPALYADAQVQDSTRPVLICSGQMDDDWQRSGDSHSYYGAIWSSRYTDIYPHRSRLHTEFGFEAPAALCTLRTQPEAWQRLQHLAGQVDELWAYQAALIQYQVEHLRRLRSDGCGGYIHFWLVDLIPQVGCGVLDACRIPKGGYAALRRASQPLHIALEHDGRQPHALWIFNDTPAPYPDVTITWQVFDSADEPVEQGTMRWEIAANRSQRVRSAPWSVPPAQCARIELAVRSANGEVLCANDYQHPFTPQRRPRGYPWKFDPYLGTKVFDRADAPSLVDQNANRLLQRIPVALREAVAERILRQHLPSAWLAQLAAIGDLVLR